MSRVTSGALLRAARKTVPKTPRFDAARHRAAIRQLAREGFTAEEIAAVVRTLGAMVDAAEIARILAPRTSRKAVSPAVSPILSPAQTSVRPVKARPTVIGPSSESVMQSKPTRMASPRTPDEI